jgi:hypothetical protein
MGASGQAFLPAAIPLPYGRKRVAVGGQAHEPFIQTVKLVFFDAITRKKTQKNCLPPFLPKIAPQICQSPAQRPTLPGLMASLNQAAST